MSDMAAQFGRLDRNLQALLKSLSVPERARLMVQIARLKRKKNSKRMTAGKSPAGEKWAPRKKKQRSGSVAATRKMMLNLRKARLLLAKGTASVAEVGYKPGSKTAEIAAVHHFGETAPVAPEQDEIKYEQRELLGLPDGDILEIQDLIIDHILSDVR